MEYGLGYIPLPVDDRDAIMNMQHEAVPDEYKINNVDSVVDQGSSPICAAISLAEILNWRKSIRAIKRPAKISPYDIYDLREDKDQDGMVLRDAIKSIKNVGVDGEKINSYARIIDPVSAKVALMLNGPLVIGLYCYNYGNRFWQGQGQNLGGHAVILTGWDKAGFVLQNSWGTGWGRSGVETFPFEDWGDWVRYGRPNYFYYCVPDGLVDPKDIPPYAGLAYVCGRNLRKIKDAPILHRDKFDPEAYKMADKFYYNWWNERRKARQIEGKDMKDEFRKSMKKVKEKITVDAKIRAMEAFWSVCDYAYWPYGGRGVSGMRPNCSACGEECKLQCPKGKEFKNKIK